MGTKLESVHVVGASIDEVEACVIRRNASAERTPFASASLAKRVYYLLESPRAVSVFANYFQDEDIAAHARELFFDLDYPVMSVRDFDDSYLEAVVSRRGEALTSLVCGPDLDAYGLSEARFDPVIIDEVFGVAGPELNSACAADDIDATLDGLAHLFGLPLDRDVTSVAGSLLHPARRLELGPKP